MDVIAEDAESVESEDTSMAKSRQRSSIKKKSSANSKKLKSSSRRFVEEDLLGVEDQGGVLFVKEDSFVRSVRTFRGESDSGIRESQMEVGEFLD
jgi:hypothetical protein